MASASGEFSCRPWAVSPSEQPWLSAPASCSAHFVLGLVAVGLAIEMTSMR